MSCSLCPSTQIRPDDSKRNAGSTSCWFGEEGLYHWQPVQPQQTKPDDSWVFGLEDQFFPLSPPEAEPSEQSSAVDGLTDEFLQFLEKRLADVDGETEDDTFPSHPPNALPAAPSVEAAKPIPPIRRRRLQRSLSLQVVKVTPTPILVDRAVEDFPNSCQVTENDQEFRPKPSLSRSGSIASDLLQRVKRWAAVTSTFRRAFRKPSPHRAPIERSLHFHDLLLFCQLENIPVF